MNVSRETSERLERYQLIVEKWNGKINLISPNTMQQFSSRHIADCAQILDHAEDVSGHWLDLGSGAGLPGLVVAIMKAAENLKVTLVESDLRKSAFLRSVIRDLSLSNAMVVSERIESLVPQNADYVSARALAPLPELLSMIVRHIHPGGTALLLKGRQWRAECENAKRDWQFDLQSFQSKTDPEAAILKIRGLSHV
ncbi:16S rRNA (guanine(527)-N(7))-methyltransferase RsmG [Paracoccus sp. Ld10]|uniref:16S rRNA (guanine(527)-N(7))-methyltransferase RsmG n=1 Tax=Paracoccus sp. Ld10 TaxID=649158 RepID=UPI0038635F95